MRLSPLRGIAKTLEARIAAAAETPSGASTQGGAAVRAGAGWKMSLLRGKAATGKAAAVDEVENARRILEACVQDVCALWRHPAVHEALRERRVVLEDESP